MRRKLMMLLLIGAISLMGVAPVLAQIQMPSPMQYVTVGEYEKATGNRITEFSEAPALRIKVAAGELPPVEKRLPEEPLVIVPVEEIGQYGGVWNRAWKGPSDSSGPNRITADSILRYDPDGKKVLPNIAKGWEFSEGGRVLTLYLRKGMKWSDGHLFTADDILFWYKDILLNDELSPAKPAWMVAGGELGKVEKVDDYTVRLRFVPPYPVVLGTLAIYYGRQGGFFAPKHYMEQFHPDYISTEKLEELTKKEGYSFWYQLFAAKNDWIQNPELPTLRAWKPINEPTASHWIMERNPYYWKVDTAGNQLPYVDQISHVLVESGEMINFKALTGELDFQLRHLILSNYPMFMKEREKNNYRAMLWDSGNASDVAFAVNLNTKDSVLHDIVNDRRLRIALSIAINREEINEICYLGLGEIRAMTVPSRSAYYKEEYAKAYIEYDPAKANSLLDEMGLKWDKDDIYRLRPDGKVLSLTIDVVPGVFGPWVDVSVLVKEYWEKVGIKTAVKTVERALWYERLYANEQEVSVWSRGSALLPAIAGKIYVPVTKTGAMGSVPLVGLWYETGGKSGMEPWGDWKKALEAWEAARVTVDEKKRIQLIQEVLRLNAENVWSIGILNAPSTMAVGVAKNNFRNVPELALSDTYMETPGNTNPPQYFFKQK